MKLVKLSVFALTMGLFVASCGNGEAKKEGGADSTATAVPAPPAEPAAPAPAPTDSAAKAPEAAPAAPAAEPKKEEGKH